MMNNKSNLISKTYTNNYNINKQAPGLQRPWIASPEGTGDVRRSCKKSPHLLVVGAGNSRDPGMVWFRQEAKRGIGGGGGAIGVEIAPSPHRRCLRTPPGLTGNRNPDRLEGGGGGGKDYRDDIEEALPDRQGLASTDRVPATQCTGVAAVSARSVPTRSDGETLDNGF